MQPGWNAADSPPRKVHASHQTGDARRRTHSGSHANQHPNLLPGCARWERMDAPTCPGGDTLLPSATPALLPINLTSYPASVCSAGWSGGGYQRAVDGSGAALHSEWEGDIPLCQCLPKQVFQPWQRLSGFDHFLRLTSARCQRSSVSGLKIRTNGSNRAVGRLAT